MSNVETDNERTSPAGTGPLLTVVVIVYNDAARLPRAVASVLNQTLASLEVVIVDDASTDGSADAAEQIAALAAGRVRVVRLADNSGGCSRPRNTGIDAARGRYVMFLDSDDELPRNACRALVEMAEETGADFSSGLCKRVHENKGMRQTSWYQWLYTQRIVHASVLDYPDLLYDTLSTNKCYRRDFLLEQDLRFPEGYHYEDLLFSAKAYLAAQRIALIPDVVYHWRVIDVTDTPSISNRRSELRNFEDRVRIHKLIDAEFAARNATELKLHKDVKFLRHDLRLYLGDIAYRDEAFLTEFLAIARDYLVTLDPRAFDRAPPLSAIVGWLIIHNDVPNLLNAIDYVAHGRKLSTRLVSRDDRIYWCAEHLDTPEGRRVLDVTELNFHKGPLSKLHLYDRATELTVDGSHLRVRGEITNQLDRLPAGAEIHAELRFHPRRRSSRTFFSAPVPVEHHGDVLTWSADVDVAGLIKAFGVLDRVWDVRVRLTVGDTVNIGRLSTRDPNHDGLLLSVRPRLGRMAADHLATLVTPSGDLAFEFVPGTRMARSIHRAGQRIVYSRAARRLAEAGRKAKIAMANPRHPRLIEEGFKHTVARLPMRSKTVVFESAGGMNCSGNPRAIYDEIRRRNLPVHAVWSYARDTRGFPTDATLVRRGSLRYFAALARAGFWIADRVLPQEAVKQPGAVFVQTGYATPLFWTGFDASGLRRSPESARYELRQQVDAWDALLTRAPYDADVLAKAFHFTGETLPFGYPRNDVLVTGADPAVIASLREQLGIRPDQQVVLHLPSCKRTAFIPDPSMLGDARQVLVARRPAHRPKESQPAGVVDASAFDIALLLSLADVLVTDHHPAIFEMPLRRRPLVLVGCECVARSRRGSNAETYIDLDKEAAGPTAWSADALTDFLADIDGLAERYADDIERVVATYGAYETGKAAAQLVDYLFGEQG